MADIRIRLPPTIHPGESVEVTTLALAPPLTEGESEFDAAGFPIPYYVAFEAEFDGHPLFSSLLGPGVSRHVMVSFFFAPDRSGLLILRWRRRDGGSESREVPVVVS